MSNYFLKICCITCVSRFDSRPMPFLNRPHKIYSTTKFQVCWMVSNFKPVPLVYVLNWTVSVLLPSVNFRHPFYLCFFLFFSINASDIIFFVLNSLLAEKMCFIFRATLFVLFSKNVVKIYPSVLSFTVLCTMKI